MAERGRNKMALVIFNARESTKDGKQDSEQTHLFLHETKRAPPPDQHRHTYLQRAQTARRKSSEKQAPRGLTFTS